MNLYNNSNLFFFFVAFISKSLHPDLTFLSMIRTFHEWIKVGGVIDKGVYQQ